MAFHEIIGQQRPIQWLRRALATNHLGHAYLFCGEPTIGKFRTALALAQYLHCEHPVTTPHLDACGSCRSCHQINQHSHPDLLILQPDEETQHNPKIKIDRIREIEHFVIYRPLVGSHKVCLVDPAEALTTEAANALLKTLEDPPAHCLFLLVSSSPEHLLSTIRSRCITLRFSPLPSSTIEEYLVSNLKMDPPDARLIATFSEGRLGSALNMDPVELKVKLRQYWALLFDEAGSSPTMIMDKSEALVKANQIKETIHWFWHGLRELLFLTLEQPLTPKIFLEQESTLRHLAKHVPTNKILGLMKNLYSLEKGQQRNLNLQIGLEEFFLHLEDSLGRTSGKTTLIR